MGASAIDNAAAFTKLLNEDSSVRAVLPVCAKCGVPPGIVVQHCASAPELDVLVYCHNENARGAVSHMAWETMRNTGEKFDLVLQVLRDLTLKLGGPPNPAPFIQPDVRFVRPPGERAQSVRPKSLRRKNAPWDF